MHNMHIYTLIIHLHWYTTGCIRARSGRTDEQSFETKNVSEQRFWEQQESCFDKKICFSYTDDLTPVDYFRWSCLTRRTREPADQQPIVRLPQTAVLPQTAEPHYDALWCNRKCTVNNQDGRCTVINQDGCCTVINRDGCLAEIWNGRSRSSHVARQVFERHNFAWYSSAFMTAWFRWAGQPKGSKQLLHKVVRMRLIRGCVLFKSFRFFLHALLDFENFCRLIVILSNGRTQRKLLLIIIIIIIWNYLFIYFIYTNCVRTEAPAKFYLNEDVHVFRHGKDWPGCQVEHTHGPYSVTVQWTQPLKLDPPTVVSKAQKPPWFAPVQALIMMRTETKLFCSIVQIVHTDNKVSNTKMCKQRKKDF